LRLSRELKAKLKTKPEAFLGIGEKRVEQSRRDGLIS